MTQPSSPKRRSKQPLIETAATAYEAYLKKLQHCIWLNNQIHEILSRIEVQWGITIKELEDIPHRTSKLTEVELDYFRRMIATYRSVCEAVPTLSGHIAWELDFLEYNLEEAIPELYQQYQQAQAAYRASLGSGTPDSRKLDAALKQVEDSFEDAERLKGMNFRLGLRLLGPGRAAAFVRSMQLKLNMVYVNLQAEATMTDGISRVYAVALPTDISYASSTLDAIIPLLGSDKQSQRATITIQDTKKRYTRLRVTVSTDTGDLEGMNPKLHFVTPTMVYLMFDHPLEGKMIACSFLP